MILNWTSSINKETFSGSDGVFTRKDVMYRHIWNLYYELSSSGWVPVSSSYYNGTTWLTGSRWESTASIKFPDSMCTETSASIITGSTDIYTPTPHSWVTLSRSADDGEGHFLTIDCRYPLPPHQPNVGVIIKKPSGPGITSITSISSVSNTQDVFIGPSAILQSTGVKAYQEIDASGDGIPDITSAGIGYLNEQYVDVFRGVSFFDQNTSFFDMNQGAIDKGQDYISRCVSFVDLVFHKGTEQLIKYNNPSISGHDITYESATTRVRPKASALDKNNWYVCWGFDYLQLEVGSSKSVSIGDPITKTNYKYAFHKCGVKSTEFIYQIYDTNNSRILSGIGFFPLKNRSSNDNISHISFCVNCDPSKDYGNKSVCFNGNGKNINYINTLNSFNHIHSRDQINNFFNTCYRNYNFSDGKNSIRAGQGDKIGNSAYYPVYAPVKPVDCVLYHEALPFSSCSYQSVPGQSLLISDSRVTTNTLYYGQPQSTLNLKNKNFFYQLPGGYKYKIPANLKSTDYVVFYYSNNTSGRKIAFQNGEILKANPISAKIVKTSPGVLPEATAINFYDNIKTINFTSTDPGLASKKIKDWDSTLQSFYNLFDPNQFKVSSKKVVLYIGKKFIREPVATTIGGSKGKVWTNKNIVNSAVKNAIIDIIFNNEEDDYNNIISSVEIFDKYIKPDFIVNSVGIPIPNTIPTSTYKIPGSVVKPEVLGTAVDCYIEVPIEDLYDSAIEIAGAGLVLNVGNFSLYSTDSNIKEQNVGAGYFSAFKTFGVRSSGNTYEETLASSLYTFAKNNEEVSRKSILGVTNKISSETNEAYLTDKDDYGSYAELPIFLFSTSALSGKFKGFLPDITFAPSEINVDGTLVSNPSGNGFIKIYWGGLWFPWVTSFTDDNNGQPSF